MMEGRTAQEKHAVADAVHNALVAAFKVSPEDKNIRMEEYKRENYILSAGKSDRYVLVEITAFTGRTVEAKRLLYKGIVERLGSLGIEPKDVFITLYEEPMDNWGIRGGYPACDLDLGFKTKV
jgi:phenylpyruvate tautomerase PptA (4-oxalocrotonate tautomerase family)